MAEALHGRSDRPCRDTLRGNRRRVGTGRFLRTRAARSRSRTVEDRARSRRSPAQVLCHESRSLPAARDQVDPRYLDVLLAYEDKRFFHHHGVDPLAFGRAALQFIAHGEIVSGGSTLTMQVARLLEPRA